VYLCKQSVILEDKFGLEYQFLKGHKYSIETKNTEKYIYARGINYITPIEKDCFFLTEEQATEYFDSICFKRGCGLFCGWFWKS
jgi:hypothetical protein